MSQIEEVLADLASFADGMETSYARLEREVLAA